MTANWVGAIFKYCPAPIKDKFLFDSGELSDPDFHTNIHGDRPLPVWAICGVFHRRDIPADEGMIFFVPVQTRWKETGLQDYICTGVLVASQKIPTKEQFLNDGRFEKEYLGRYLKGLEGKTQLATTIINIFELYYGAYKSREVNRNLAAVKGLRSTLQVLGLTEAAAERAGKILANLENKGQPIDSRDLFVGAICLEHGFAVLTDNTEHFSRVPELETLPEKDFARTLHKGPR